MYRPLQIRYYLLSPLHRMVSHLDLELTTYFSLDSYFELDILVGFANKALVILHGDHG